MQLSLLARSRNCYKIYNSQIKKQTSPGKAQLSLLMRPERRFSPVSSHTLKSIRINRNWNHGLFRLWGSSSSTPSQELEQRLTSQGHILALGLLDLEEEEGIQATSFLPLQIPGEGWDVACCKHRCPFTWWRSHLPPPQVSLCQRAGMPQSCPQGSSPPPPCHFLATPRGRQREESGANF